MSAVEAMVAAAAQAAGPIEGDPGRWSDAVRRAAAAQVVIAADMTQLMEALSAPNCKRFARTITGVRTDHSHKTNDKTEWFVIEFQPPIEYESIDGPKSFGSFRTDFCDDPRAQFLARVARESVGRQCMLYQRNDPKPEGAGPKVPDAGYRRLVHLEPLAVGTEPRIEHPPARVVDMTERRQERASAPKPPEHQSGPIVGTDPTLPQKPSEALREMTQPIEDLSKAALDVVKLISPLLGEDERVRFQQEFVALLKHNALPPLSKWPMEPWAKVEPAVKLFLRVCSQGTNPGLKAALLVAREMLGLPAVDVPAHEPDEEPW